MRPRARLAALAAGGLLAAGLGGTVGTVTAQPPPDTPAYVPPPEDGVAWGPIVEQRPARPRPPRRPREHEPAPEPRPDPPARERPAAPPPAADGCVPEQVALFTPGDDRDARERADGRRREAVAELRRCREEAGDRRRRRPRRDPLRNRDGSPTPSNPTFFDALPGPSTATGVPNFVIRKFRVPVFLLPIYQAAGIQYGIRWEILAAINEIETDYGRNLNVSSAGALGWMQFIPSSWRAYGVDANKDGVKDPYNPVDAIFAAARYLHAAGYEEDVRRAIFAYNHADWYVDSVMLRARLIAGVPADLVGSLTGLTEGRFPVYARARYADDPAESKGTDPSIRLFARRGAPVVAVNDGVIKKIARSRELGRYVVLQDVYGNRYTYARLGDVAELYPVPKNSAHVPGLTSEAVRANDSHPERPASAGRQAEPRPRRPAPARTQASLPVKERLFAHPSLPLAREAGGLEQIAGTRGRGDGFEYFDLSSARPLGLRAKDVRLRRLKAGARVSAGTLLGRVGQEASGGPHLRFGIRPAGRGAPAIDPKPILDGWKLLEATAIYRAKGQNVLHGSGSVGQVLLLAKPLLEERVLGDERIEVYACGRRDIRSGQVDRRVLATLAYLAESGLRPTVSSLRCGHSYYTSSGNVSHHSSGNAVDISAINGMPVMGHQERGGVTEQAVRQLMRLQGTMRPDQVISLIELGGPTFAMADHADHIHVGFAPLFGANARLGRQAFAVLEPGQWSDLLERLREIENPVVPTGHSRFSLRVED